jgi:serine/threonine protein kinase
MLVGGWVNTTEVPLPPLPERYTVLRALGGGGMGQLLLASDSELGGKTVVVKLIREDLAHGEAFQARFRLEQSIIRQFDHPNIPTLLAYGEDPLHLVIPYVDGGSLLSELERVGRLSLAGTLHIARQIAAALDYAHGQGILHRDVTPSNVLLHRGTDHAYLCDFGVALDVGGARLTGGPGYAGTPGYLAPECYGRHLARLYGGPDGALTRWLDHNSPGLTGDGTVDGRVDVYGLGAVIYQCLTGQPAFAAADQVVRAQLSTDPPPPTSLQRTLPRGVDEVLRKALARDPDHRYPTCTALITALSTAAATPPRRRTPAALAHRATTAIRRVAAPDLAARQEKGPASRGGGPATGPAGGSSSPVRWGTGGVGVGRQARARRRWVVGGIAGVAVVGVAAAVTAVAVAGGGGNEVGRVPAALRGHCVGADRGSGVPGASDVLSCSAGSWRVAVSLFGSGAATDTAYAGVVRKAGVGTGSGDCVSTAGSPGAEHRYPGTGTVVGRVVCWARAGVTTFAWSDDRERTVAEVSGHTGDAAGLAGEWARWVGLPAYPSAGDTALAGLVGLSGCRRPAMGDLDDLDGVSAAVQCDAPGTGAGSVSYYRFGSVDALRRAQRGRVGRVAAPAGVDCGDGSAPGFLGDHPLDLRSVVVGDLLCHQDARHAPVLEWTLEPLRLMGVATGTSGAELASWWRGYFGYGGPSSALAAAVDRQASPAFPTGSEQRLLDRVPAPSRVDCMRPSAQQVRDLVGPVPVTAVVCGPTRGAGIVFYFQFTDAASTAAAYTRNNDISGPDCTTQPADFHGDAPYSRGGGSGRLGCERSTAGTLDLYWSDTSLEIVGMAFAATSAPLLLDWWRWDAGPTH